MTKGMSTKSSNKKTNKKNMWPYIEYEKALEKILDLVIKDYWTQYVEINSHQIKVAQLYLWVAAALIGAYSTFFITYSDLFIKTPFCIQLVLFISLILAVIAFGLSLYSVPAFKGYSRIKGSWGTYSQKAHQELLIKKSSLYRDILTDVIDDYDKFTNENLNTNCDRAKRLRLTFWLLLSSFILSFITLLGIGIQKSLVLKTGGFMSKETSQDAQSGNSKINLGTEQKPDARPPKGPIENSHPTIITHAEDSEKGNKIVVLTEDKEKKK